MLVVDANVAVKWFVDQTDRRRALEVQRHPAPLIAPVLIVTEVTTALWRHWRNGDITPEQAIDALKALPSSFATLVADIELREAAFRLAVDLKHIPDDCFYLALAQMRGARLVTADQAFFDKLFRKRLHHNVVLLHNWS